MNDPYPFIVIIIGIGIVSPFGFLAFLTIKDCGEAYSDILTTERAYQQGMITKEEKYELIVASLIVEELDKLIPAVKK